VGFHIDKILARTLAITAENVVLEHFHTEIVPYGVDTDLFRVDVIQIVADIDQLAEGFPVVGLLFEFSPIEMMRSS
jgi:hypothetical protein